MTTEHNVDFLFLIWKDPQTRRNYTVGKLTRDNGYRFEYSEEYDLAKQQGWHGLDAFPQKQVYESEDMFPVFASRLPDFKRRDIEKILDKYELPAYDAYELLRKSGARLPIDTYEFIDPIFSENTTIQRDFFVMGIRHSSACAGKNCAALPSVLAGDLLVFRPEPENPNDPLAICIETRSGEHLGYVPRYYNQAILECLAKGTSYSCRVLEINTAENCSECIKVRLNIPASN